MYCKFVGVYPVSIPFREDLHSDTSIASSGKHRKRHKVSIPFREDLYSDEIDWGRGEPMILPSFPSLSGKTFIRTRRRKRSAKTCRKVSIPFREELHSDGGLLCFKRSGLKIGFHPFQGRPPFGPNFAKYEAIDSDGTFPSLSGKTSIRTHRCQRS